MRRLTGWTTAGLLGLAATGACGGGGDSNGPGSGSGFTATIDGQAWEATEISIAANPIPGLPGALLITGNEGGTDGRGVVITLSNISGTGTYPLGVGSDVYGGTGQVGQSNNGWITDTKGTAGTITLTTLTASHITGSFSFVAEPGHSNTVGGNRVVTNGHFDLPFGGALTPVPANKGSMVTATLGSDPYIAWSVNGLLQDHLGGAGFQFSSATSDHGLSILLSGTITPGTYTLTNTGAIRVVTAGRNGGDANHCCWGSGSADVGTITITSITAQRVKGTITATLQPQPGKAAVTPLVITDAAFDVGIP